MEAVREYAFINAKVRGMRSRFLPDAFLRSLASARDAKEAAALLSQTPFRDAFAGVDPDSPEAVELALEREEVRRLRVIGRFAKGRSAAFVRTLGERYDAERLKSALRRRHAGLPAPEPGTSSEPVSVFFPEDKIVAAPTLAAAAALLSGTCFGDAVAGAVPASEERRSLFPVEIAVDRAVFRRLWDAGNALNGQDRRILRRTVGVEIDLKNLDWAHRFRRYYKLTFSEIRELLLPGGGRLDPAALGRLMTEDRMPDAFAKVTRGTGVTPPEADSGPGPLERFLSHALFAEAKRAFRGNPLSIGSLIGYFYCMRIESRNLKTLFAGKRFGLGLHQIEPDLIW